MTLNWFIDEEKEPLALAAMALLATGPAYVPALWHWEVRNGFLMAERRGRTDIARVTADLAQLTKMDVRTAERTDWLRVVDIARRHGLTVYDASYLALALDRNASLATLDRALAQAAAAEGVQPLPQIPA